MINIGFLIFVVKMIFEPVVDAIITGLSFGIAANFLNSGRVLWNMAN